MKNILKNNSGDVGIGTLIVFIAMVLVAAVAAAVLIQTSGVLQQKAQTTGTEATAEVSSNIKVISIVGTDVGTDGDINKMNITVALASGGDSIDMSKVIVKYLSNDDITTHSLNDSMTTTDGGSDVSTYFEYGEFRHLVGGDNDVLSSGDLGYITLYLNGSTAQNLDKRGKGKIIIMPETGTSVIKDVVAPATFKGKTEIQLFP